MLAGDTSILTNDRSSGQSGHIQKTIGAPRIIYESPACFSFSGNKLLTVFALLRSM
jgi:hypothetical protein